MAAISFDQSNRVIQRNEQKLMKSHLNAEIGALWSLKMEIC